MSVQEPVYVRLCVHARMHVCVCVYVCVCVCVARGQNIADRLYTVARTNTQQHSSWSQGRDGGMERWRDGEMEGRRDGGTERWRKDRESEGMT